MNLDPLPRLTAARLAGADSVGLRGSVLPGRSYVLEASANLHDWTPLRTNTALTSASLFQFADSGIMSQPQRFYRLVERK